MTNKSRPFGKQTQTCKAALPLPASIAFILMFGCATWLQRIEIGESLCWRSVDGIWSCRSGMTRHDSTILMNHDCDRWYCISSRCWQFAPKLLHHPALHAISFHHFSFISHLSHPYQTIMYHQLHPYNIHTVIFTVHILVYTHFNYLIVVNWWGSASWMVFRPHCLCTDRLRAHLELSDFTRQRPQLLMLLDDKVELLELLERKSMDEICILFQWDPMRLNLRVNSSQ